MNIDASAWAGMLEKTLEDEKLSSSERQALRARIRDAALDDHARALLRSAAFELARKRMPAPDAGVIGWLEEVSKLLLPFSGDAGEPFVEAHFSPGEACARRIVGLLGGARKSVDVCVFTITDDRIADALLAAHRRGVAVRVVTDDDKAGDAGSDALRLAKGGVGVKMDDSPFHMHHKFAVFDGDVLLTGSYNWTRGAAANNQENLVLTNDRRLLTAFQGEFDRLWVKFEPLPA